MADDTERPVEPGPGECCGGGSCCPCVWDAYFAELKKWQQAQGIEPLSEQPDKAEKPDPERFYR